MSLLLDALNRASKDKAALAAATVSKDIEPTLESPDPKASRAASAQARPGVDFSTIELSLTEPDSVPTKTPTKQADANRADAKNDADLRLVIEPQPPAPPATPEFRAEPLAEPAAAVVHSAPTPNRPSSAPTPPAKLVPANPAARLSAPGGGPHLAQTILRAKEPKAQDAVPKRLIALGTVAVLLAAGLGSVLMGWWGDPMSWFQTHTQQGPAQSASVIAKVTEPVATPAAASVAALVPSVPASAPSPVANQAPAVTAAIVKPAAKPPVKAQTVRTEHRPAHLTTTAAASKNKASIQSTPKALPANGSASLLQKNNGPSALELGYAALTAGNLQEAKQAYTQALLGNSEERDALLGLAYIEHQQGHTEEARAYYKRVLRQEPGNPVAKSGLLSLNPTGDVQEASSQAREVAEQNPNSAAAQSVLGQSLVRQDRMAEAQLAFQRAHLLEPRVALHAFNLAVALDRLHQYGPARLYYERAMTLSAQSGGQRASGVPHAVVRERLEQLQGADGNDPVGARQ